MRKRWLTASVVSNLGLLFAFKYTAVRLRQRRVTRAAAAAAALHDRTWNILLPLGISFHTFQGISYTVDVYRRQIRAVRSFRRFRAVRRVLPAAGGRADRAGGRVPAADGDAAAR